MIYVLYITLMRVPWKFDSKRLMPACALTSRYVSGMSIEHYRSSR